jgi:hypothetical protein
VAARLGVERCSRIPTDYFLVSVDDADLESATPLSYDWDLLGRLLTLPDGAETTTPDFDFTVLRRRAEFGGRPVVTRLIMLTDGFAPAPQNKVRVLLDAPAALRRDRVAARDRKWRTRVVARWARLEATWTEVCAHGVVPDLALDGIEPVEANVARIVELIEGDAIARRSEFNDGARSR